MTFQLLVVANHSSTTITPQQATSLSNALNASYNSATMVSDLVYTRFPLLVYTRFLSLVYTRATPAGIDGSLAGSHH